MDHFPNRRWTWNILETTSYFMGSWHSTIHFALSFPQLLGWKIDNPSGNFAALVANAQSFIAQEPPPSHRTGHKFPDWDFEGLKIWDHVSHPIFPEEYSRSKLAREIRCSSSRRLNIHTFYILICIEICIIVYIEVCHQEILRVRNHEMLRLLEALVLPTASVTQLFWDVFLLSHRLGME